MTVRTVSPVLIGRARELTQLRQALTHPPAVVLVEGEAGIGKTRLLRECLDHPDLARLPRMVGHCSPLHEPLPFGPVIDALPAPRPHPRWCA